MALDTEEKESPADRDRGTAPVQLPVSLVRMLRVIVAHRGVTQAEFLSPLIRNRVGEEYRKVLSELNSAEFGEAGES